MQLWTYFTPCPSVLIVNFEQVNADWEVSVTQQVADTLIFNVWCPLKGDAYLNNLNKPAVSTQPQKRKK